MTWSRPHLPEPEACLAIVWEQLIAGAHGLSTASAGWSDDAGVRRTQCTGGAGVYKMGHWCCAWRVASAPHNTVWWVRCSRHRIPSIDPKAIHYYWFSSAFCSVLDVGRFVSRQTYWMCTSGDIITSSNMSSGRPIAIAEKSPMHSLLLISVQLNGHHDCLQLDPISNQLVS